jgi:hypothetical protein
MLCTALGWWCRHTIADTLLSLRTRSWTHRLSLPCSWPHSLPSLCSHSFILALAGVAAPDPLVMFALLESTSPYGGCNLLTQRKDKNVECKHRRGLGKLLLCTLPCSIPQCKTEEVLLYTKKESGQESGKVLLSNTAVWRRTRKEPENS